MSDLARSLHSVPDESASDVGADPPNESRMRKLILVAPGGRVVCDICHFANKPHTRLKGIIGWNQLRQGEGMLLHPTFSIHTAFVRFPIDGVFLDKEMTIVAIAHELKPWRLAGARKARSVLELAAGECARLGLQRGDRLGWANL